MTKIKHEFEPIFDKNSKVLILGTMPSVISREEGFYYAHPKNRFWWVLEQVFNTKIENKKTFLLEKNIALWDVLSSCEIKSSSDATIKNATPNDLKTLLYKTKIKAIFTTGKTAYKYYIKFFQNKIFLPVFCLPSTSPANCKVKNEELIEAYNIIRNILEK